MEDITLQQEKFCRLFTQNSELFGNATLSYAEAYDYKLDELSPEHEKDADGLIIPDSSPRKKAYDICSASASRLLRNDKIQEFVRKYLNELMKDTVVDAELARVIMQDRKLESKVAAIKEYNKLKNRIVEKVDVAVTSKIISVDE